MVSGKETVTPMILGIVRVAVFCIMTLNLLLRKEGEVITDSCLKIGGKLYHSECQSVDDTTMAIRMVEVRR